MGIPYRMELPGGRTPISQVVICLDVSDSMWDVPAKIASARIAAQALALAVQESGGQAVGILFHQIGLASFAPKKRGKSEKRG